MYWWRGYFIEKHWRYFTRIHGLKHPLEWSSWFDRHQLKLIWGPKWKRIKDSLILRSCKNPSTGKARGNVEEHVGEKTCLQSSIQVPFKHQLPRACQLIRICSGIFRTVPSSFVFVRLGIFQWKNPAVKMENISGTTQIVCQQEKRGLFQSNQEFGGDLAMAASCCWF